MYSWRRCRALVRRGEKRDKKADKLADYDLARQDCQKAVALSSGSVDAHFWYGISMGRWGEAKGIMKALFMIKPIRQEMAAVLALDPKHGGAHRVLGEMLWQIPGFAGGDKKKALEEFETAVKLSPNYSSNYQPLAEAYLHFDRKDEAIKTLNAVLSIANPEDPVEYADDRADAKARLAKLTAK
jgi:tetratricopeptide (TPR) repeat protein